ncbi:MAG TPA: extracellular solute-binding protein [Chloroflexota bacterium]|jgi:iron(III) transport system substrate-binding protein
MRRLAAIILLVALGLSVACGPGGGAAGGSAPASKPSGAAPASGSAPTAGSPAGSAPAASGGAASGAASASASNALDAVIAAAANEGVFQFYGPSALSKPDADRLMAAFNQKYGLNIEYQFTQSGSMTRDTARLITEIGAGQAPTWDLMMMTDAHYAMLYSNGVLDPVDWVALGIGPRSVSYDGAAIMAASTFVAPAYNPNLVSADQAPKDWGDLADPKWRGKIGVSTATHFWARLAQAWGDERTTRLMEGIAANQPVLGNLPETYTRVTLGELAIFSSASDSYWIKARKEGAPLTIVETAKPIIAQQYDVGLLKGVRHPNQAKLMAVFLVSPEGQALWEELQGQTSMFVEGTTANRYAQGKDVVTLDPKFGTDQLDDLTEKYGKMVGFR